MYTSQITEITEIAEYVDNFFAFTQQEKFPDALTNGRKLAEAVCKLVIFEKHGEPKKVRTYRTPIDKRMLGDLIPEVKGLIDNTSVIDAIGTLKNEGNPATHTGMRQFTSEEISKCEPHVRYLVGWLFTTLLKKAIPADIQDSLDNRLRILNIFLPLHSLLKLGDYQELFDNQLVFFTPEEEDMIEQMSQKLIHTGEVLLLGDPATGKSITAIALAEKLKALGYHRYYHSLKIRTQKEGWDDIALLVHRRKALFIIDDCHLNVDTFASIYRKFHQWENPMACLLFVSRQVSKSLQQSVQYEFNVFEKLENVTFTLRSDSLEDKIKGIIVNYQRYYSSLDIGKSYEIGEVTTIIQNVHKNLLTLSFYLKLWKDMPMLSSIDRVKVLNSVYANYFRGWNEAQVECLLHYACLYHFEIEFESLPQHEDDANLLAEKGIILEDQKHTYSFYHSDFAILLLEAYEAYDRFNFEREYGDFDSFLFEKIKSYILSFSYFRQHRYPRNLHMILSNLGRSEKPFLLEKLITDATVKSVVIEFYSNQTDGLTLFQFLFVLSKRVSAHFNDYFETLQERSVFFRNFILSSEYSLAVYISTLINLKGHQAAYNRFWTQWKSHEHTFVKNASIKDIGQGLRLLQLYINAEKANELYNAVSNDTLIPKITQASLEHLGKALNELNRVNHRKTSELFSAIDNNLLIPKITQASLEHIGKALNELNQVNPNKASELFTAIDNNLLIPKITQASLEHIGCALNELNQVNPNKASELFTAIDNNLLIPKITQASLEHIGCALNELNQVNPNKASELFTAIDNNLLIPKITQASLEHIGQALSELNWVNPSKASELLAGLQESLFVQKAANLNIVRLAHALSELNQINTAKTQSIFKALQANLIVEKMVQEIHNTKYEAFLPFFSIFPELDATFGKSILQRLNFTYLFQWVKLENIFNFNYLLNILSLAEFDKEDEKVKQLVSFAQQNMDMFFRVKSVAPIVSFLRLLANYMPVQPIITKYVSKFVGKILWEQDQSKIPLFIGIIHAHIPNTGLYLLKRFKQKYSNAKEIIGFTHYHIGKNYLEQSKPQEAQKHLQQARSLFAELNHEIGLKLLQELQSS